MRAKLEVADIFRRHGDTFRAAQGNRLSLDQRKVMAARMLISVEAAQRNEMMSPRVTE